MVNGRDVAKRRFMTKMATRRRGVTTTTTSERRVKTESVDKPKTRSTSVNSPWAQLVKIMVNLQEMGTPDHYNASHDWSEVHNTGRNYGNLTVQVKVEAREN
jgi:hypothetical protein